MLGRWRPKKEHKVVVGIPRSKCTRNKTVNEDVVDTYSMSVLGHSVALVVPLIEKRVVLFCLALLACTSTSTTESIW